MAKIELEIVASNEQYLQAVKEVETATESMTRASRKRQADEKGIIEAIVEGMDQLQKARMKANDPKDIEKYNKKLAEAKAELNAYNKAGLDQAKTQESSNKTMSKMWTTLKGMAITYVTVTAAIKAFNAIMNSTQGSADLLKREITGVKFATEELFRSIATGNVQDLGKRMAEARQAGLDYADSLDKIGDRERQLKIEESRRSVRLAELAKIWRNTADQSVAGQKKQIDAAEEYIRLLEEQADDAVELAQIRLDAELKVARQASGLTDAEILRNLERAKVYEANAKAIETYAGLLQKLAAEEAKGTTVASSAASTRGGSMMVVDQSDPKLIAEYNKAIEATDKDIILLYQDTLKWNKVIDPQRDKIVAALVAIEQAKAAATKGSIRANVEAERSGNILTKAEKKDQTDREKQLEEFIKETTKLQDEYLQSQILLLTGEEKIEAEKMYQLRQIANLQAHLETLGKLTEDHLTYIMGLEDAVYANAEMERAKFLLDKAKEDEQEKQLLKKSAKEKLELQKELELSALDLVKDSDIAKLEVEKKFMEMERQTLIEEGSETALLMAEIVGNYIKAIENQITIAQSNKDRPTIWKLIGIDPDSEDGKAAKEALELIVSNVVGTLDMIYNERVANADRNRQLIEDEIAFTQRALDTELALYEAGYANNVEAKKKELALLNEQRKAAIIEQEKAVKAQQKLDTVIQVSSLITASADIFKSLSKLGPIGISIAIATIASMFAAFAKSKVQAAKATKLAKGGTGTVDGRSHAEGGEPFLSHVEVERGEMWGVLNRRASMKYGKVFGAMVNGFNKDRFPLADAREGSIVLDVEETNARLGKLEYQLVKLNRNFGGKKEVHEYGNMRVEKSGNKTRIIRKNAI